MHSFAFSVALISLFDINIAINTCLMHALSSLTWHNGKENSFNGTKQSHHIILRDEEVDVFADRMRTFWWRGRCLPPRTGPPKTLPADRRSWGATRPTTWPSSGSPRSPTRCAQCPAELKHNTRIAMRHTQNIVKLQENIQQSNIINDKYNK